MPVEPSSQVAGYLPPKAAPAPLEGQALNEFFQAVVAGITGLAGKYVRPAFQFEPPVIPEAATAWAAIATATTDADTFPYVGHKSAGNGSDELQRNERINVLASFYDAGTNGQADRYSSLLRDGLAIAQNRETLELAGMGLNSVGSKQVVPSLLKERWLYRVDLPIIFVRCLVREYAVQNLLTANATLAIDGGPVLEINITP